MKLKIALILSALTLAGCVAPAKTLVTDNPVKESLDTVIQHDRCAVGVISDSKYSPLGMGKVTESKKSFVAVNDGENFKYDSGDMLPYESDGYVSSRGKVIFMMIPEKSRFFVATGDVKNAMVWDCK